MNNLFNWIFFDLDGTLADSIPALFQSYLNFLSEFDLVGSKLEFDELNGPSMTEIISILKSRHNLKQDEKTLIKLYNTKIADLYMNSVLPIDGAESILKDLQKNGLKLMLVTSSIKEIALNFIKCRNWENYFEDFVFGDEIKNSKPNPEIYNLALKKALTSTKNVAVVEDSINGIKSAKNAGLSVIGLANTQTEERLLNAGANITISHLQQISTILKDNLWTKITK